MLDSQLRGYGPSRRVRIDIIPLSILTHTHRSNDRHISEGRHTFNDGSLHFGHISDQADFSACGYRFGLNQEAIYPGQSKRLPTECLNPADNLLVNAA
ncbi:hypothetical protein D3C85_1596570 [compost metagenome]